MIGYSEDGADVDEGRGERLQGPGAVRAVGEGGGKMDLSQTFDNSFAKKAAAKYR